MRYQINLILIPYNFPQEFLLTSSECKLKYNVVHEKSLEVCSLWDFDSDLKYIERKEVNVKCSLILWSPEELALSA